MKKNDIVNLNIETLGGFGEGVAKSNGTIFVPFALDGEQVEAQILKAKENYAYAKLLKVLRPSPKRVKPKCSVFTKCGGCSLQHLNYEAQKIFKKQLVNDMLTRAAGFDAISNDTVCGEHPFNYRNKISVPVSVNDKGFSVGFYAPNSNRIIEFKECFLQGQWANNLVKEFKVFLETSFQIPAAKSPCRHLVARQIEGATIVTVVTTRADMVRFKPFSAALKKMFGDYFAFYANINTSDNNVILSDEFVLLDGNPIDITQNGLKYTLHPKSFFQVNDQVQKLLYQDVIQLAESGQVLIDAYSGAGILTAKLAKHFDMVFGIEIEKQAFISAQSLKANNQILNMTNILGDCKDKLPELIKQHPDAFVIVDPPKAGCHERVLESLRNCRNIIYISCNLATLGRDLKILKGYGFELNKVTPYDMFPQTPLVETVVSLKRK